MDSLKLPGSKSLRNKSPSKKLPIINSVNIKSPNNYVTRKIVNKTNITPKSEYHKSCLPQNTIEVKENYVNLKNLISPFNSKSRPKLKSDSSIYNTEQKSEETNLTKYTVCISKSERKSNINIISIKSSVNKNISKTSEITNHDENSQKVLKYPRVQALQLINSSAENLTPKDSIPVVKNRIKVDHKKRKEDKERKGKSYTYLDKSLIYNKEYKDDFIELQLELDTSHKLSPTFLMKNISAEQRKLAIKSLLKFAAESLYPSLVTFQSVKILDAMIDAKYLDNDQLELISLSALWISLKRLHPFDDIPSARKIMSVINDEKGQEEKLLYDCEKDILTTLNFEISFPDPISMVVLCLQNLDDDYPYEVMYYTALYLIDLSLLNEYFSQIPISHLVISTTQISLFITVKDIEGMKHPPWHFWRASFPKSLWGNQSVPDMEVEIIRKKMIRIALLSQKPDSDYRMVFEKYKTSRFGKVSKLIANRLNSLSDYEYE